MIYPLYKQGPHYLEDDDIQVFTGETPLHDQTDQDILDGIIENENASLEIVSYPTHGGDIPL